MKIIVINGYAGSGKDLFVKYAQRNFTDIFNISMVDYIKEIARKIGWNGEKDEKGRKFLSDIKDALTAYDDIPFKRVILKMDVTLNTYNLYSQSTKDCIFFIHCREPEDIDKFVKQYNAKTLLIRRPVVEKPHENHADNNVLDYDYDFTYENIYDKERMEEDVVAFIKWIKGQSWKSDGNDLTIWDRSE